MTTRHSIEIFSSGCALCKETIALVDQVATSGCEIKVQSMNDAAVVARAKSLGVARVPAVVIDGKLAQCCEVAAPDAETLRAALT